MKKLTRITICLTIIFSILSSSYAMGQWLNLPDKPKAAADFILYDLKGNKVSLADFKGKKQLVLFFWTTWCPHCQEQIGNVNKLSQRLQDKNVSVLGIDVGESQQKVEAFMQRRSVSFSVLLDWNTEVSEKYAVVGVPTFVIIGLDGAIKFHDNGLPDKIDEVLFGK